MNFVFSAFRERRGPFGKTAAGRKGDDDDDFEGGGEPVPVDPAIERSLAVFKKLFELLLSAENAPRHAATAFDLTQYICERLQPDFSTAAIWLYRLIDVLVRINPPERREDIVAAILTSLGASTNPSEYRNARARLFRLGVDISGEAPSPDTARGFQSVLIQTESFAELWAQLQTVRTLPEQARAYLADLATGRPSFDDYHDLALEVPEEWPVLQDAFKSEDARDRIIELDRWTIACPRHHRTLPSGEIQKLRATSIATTKNCCQCILIFRGD